VKRLDMPDESWKFWFVGDSDAEKIEDGKATLICEKDGQFLYYYGGENPPHWDDPGPNAVEGGKYEKTIVITRDRAKELMSERLLPVHIAKTMIGDVIVSTVHLKMDPNTAEFLGGNYETMILGGEHDEYQVRHRTREEAELGHKIAVTTESGSPPTIVTKSAEPIQPMPQNGRIIEL